MRRLPIFPLPVVLFPGGPMPLHIFEPRYRQMVAHCVEGDSTSMTATGLVAATASGGSGGPQLTTASGS